MEEHPIDLPSAIEYPKLNNDADNFSIVRSKSIVFATVSNSSANNLNGSSSSSEDETFVVRVKKRLQRFSESDRSTDKENSEQNFISVTDDNIENWNDGNLKKTILNHSLNGHFDDSDSDCEVKTVKNEGKKSRMETKRTKTRKKFRNPFTSTPRNNSNNDSQDEVNKSSEDSEPETSSMAKIKQFSPIKEKTSFKSSICDPDTSDDEETRAATQKKQKPNQKMILTSPKPIRMSAKQAMENMHKIKSESNRLLREKEVSLPYHRPKALSLKDIMNRRKPVLTADGKALPIKMNEQQLKEYALLLEQRQKEIMELCKSDTDEENDEKSADTEDIIKEPIVTEICKNSLKLYENQLMPSNYIKKMENTIETIDTSKGNPTEQNLNGSALDINKKEFQDINKNEAENHDSVTNMNISQEESDMETRLTNKGTLSDKMFAETINNYKQNDMVTEDDTEKQLSNVDGKKDSQLISLHYGSEENDTNNHIYENLEDIEKDKSAEIYKHDFSEDSIDFNYIDKIIENAEIIKDAKFNTTGFIKEGLPLRNEPKLIGAPGMVIDLDGTDAVIQKKNTGLELLKERFIYFAKLRTPEELEREREKRLKPGTQHQKLKQELEEKIAEQRSIEWAKRFEEEKQQQIELRTLRGDTSDLEDDIEKAEAKLEDNTVDTEESSSEEEEEIIEMKENPRKKNPMLDDEAKETDCENEDAASNENLNDQEYNDEEEIEDEDDDDDDNKSSDDDSSDNESSESETEQPNHKRGRILKGFEDSDDENTNITDKVTIIAKSTHRLDEKKFDTKNEEDVGFSQEGNHVIKDSLDDPIQLAQRVKSVSDDLFTSQESGLMSNKENESYSSTQTFSILDSKLAKESTKIHDSEKPRVINVIQPYDFNLNNAALDSETYTEDFITSQITKPTSASQSQPFGDDVLALCTGKFYDNEFISQTKENAITNNGMLQTAINNNFDDSNLPKDPALTNFECNVKDKSEQANNDGNVLQSILEELHHSEFDALKPNKFFFNKQDSRIDNTLLKKKFVIDSDEEDGNETNFREKKKNKNIKKRKHETRILQISDDEDVEKSYEEEVGEYMSDLEDKTGEQVVEYDSEENEIEVQLQNPKKKRKVPDFFEQEAELTSEDEWIGSGDEDEADLDRMEREEGDNDVFHQGKLQKELGQIHMRDVLDQDKREVRLIQELLFEDGDLGGGHRQRKFRWRNADGNEENGTVADGFSDTQEEEFESEELWRKQRHEREVFLRQMEKQDESGESVNVSLNRTTIIKANLCSKTMSSLLLEVNSSTNEKTDKAETPVIQEKKTSTDPSSPKKAFSIFQQNYHGSLLTRGRGALARLAALATPLAIDDDAPKIGSLGPSNRRNFVFASVTPDDKQKKVSKRKVDNKTDTPQLVKKLKTDEKKTFNKNSLLSHLKV